MIGNRSRARPRLTVLALTMFQTDEFFAKNNQLVVRSAGWKNALSRTRTTTSTSTIRDSRYHE